MPTPTGTARPTGTLTGTPRPSATATVTARPTGTGGRVAAFDLDGDGRPDVAAADWFNGEVEAIPSAKGALSVPPRLVPLSTCRHAGRGDNFQTVTPIAVYSAVTAGYVKVRQEGCVYDKPYRAWVAANQYWSPVREDNDLASSPGGRAAATGSGYALVRAEGYVTWPAAPGTIPLKTYWSGARGDNFVTATADGERDALAAGYAYVGIEAYVFPATECK
jgi:hypothetical protein